MHRPFALPGVRPRYAPDRAFQVRHLRLELQLDYERKSVAGNAVLSLARRAAARHLELDAVEMKIGRVLVDDQAVPFEYDGERLRVLGEHLKDAFDVTIEYACQPRRGLYFVGPEPAYPKKPREIWSQGQDEDSRHWFPCFDAPNQKATTELIVTVPAGMTAISNGKLVAHEGNRFHFKLDIPHSPYLVMLAAGHFAELRAKWQDVDVLYYVPQGREEDAERAFGRTPEMIAFFSDYLGVQYPWPKYAQVCVNDFLFGGMENTSATTLTVDTLHDARAAIDYTSEPLVSHELAHQWFGDLLTCRDWSEGWLNEGFATYLETLWKQHAHGIDEATLEVVENQDLYLAEDAGRYRRPIVTRQWDEPLEIFDRHLYEKGSLVLHMLRRKLGDEPFRAALRHYVEKHRGGVVESRDLARAIEDSTGRNVDRFFDQWVYGAGHPELKVGYAWDADAGAVRLEIEQTQETPFDFDTAVAAEVGGEWRTIPLSTSEKNHVFFLPMAQAPTACVIDPGRHLLARWSIEKPQPLWRRELAAAPNAMDRAAAAAGCGKDTSSTEALAVALRSDSFWAVRAACAKALGSLRTTAARDALLAALGAEEHAKARRAIVRALGEFRYDETVAAALQKRFESGDASYFVEAETVHALCRTRAPQALEVARAALGRPSYLDVIRQYACIGLGELREPEELRDAALGLLRKELPWGNPPPSRRVAADALGRLGEGKPEIRVALTDLLDDADFRVRNSIVNALAWLGDARAVGPLQVQLERELDGRVKRRIKEVVRDLREGARREETIQKLREDVDKLRGDYAKLQERFDKLETRLPK
jgi:aminopeptidase N